MDTAFRRVKDVFLAALDRADPAARGAYLAGACGADGELRRRVEALLRRHEQAGSFLETPSEDPSEQTDLDSPTRPYATGPGPEAGAVVAGRYKLLDVIGEGGMGTVWLAEQQEPVRRRVALKV